MLGASPPSQPTLLMRALCTGVECPAYPGKVPVVPVVPCSNTGLVRSHIRYLAMTRQDKPTVQTAAEVERLRERAMAMERYPRCNVVHHVATWNTILQCNVT